ncbi:MAG: NYN domain-containing protein [Desulfobacterales bacterium]|nr:NYN domain-containing protein [Desulfobacterales bacterium]
MRDAQATTKFDIKHGAGAPAAQGQHRGQEGLLRLGALQGASRRAMHEAAFELIEIPHVRQSGKNSADIRMVVDALDLCYTKAHVDTFVIISGDSDFSPLVSQAARERQDGDRRRREEVHLRPADRQLRRVHLLRRPGARAAKRAAPRHARHRSRAKRPPDRGEAGARSEGEDASQAGDRPGGRDLRGADRRARRRARRSGPRWSSRRSSAASPASTRATTASAPSATCWRRRRRAACWRWSATRSRAPTSIVPRSNWR